MSVIDNAVVVTIGVTPPSRYTWYVIVELSGSALGDHDTSVEPAMRLVTEGVPGVVGGCGTGDGDGEGESEGGGDGESEGDGDSESLGDGEGGSDGVAEGEGLGAPTPYAGSRAIERKLVSDPLLVSTEKSHAG